MNKYRLAEMSWVEAEEAFKRSDTVIIGVADPDPKQLDLFAEKVLPLVKA